VCTDFDDPTQFEERKGSILWKVSMVPVVRVADAENLAGFIEVVELFYDDGIASIYEIAFQSRTRAALEADTPSESSAVLCTYSNS
jgi:hypothetical protein